MYLFGYWLFDLEMRKTKQSVFPFSIFVPIIENRKWQKAFDIGIKIPIWRDMYIKLDSVNWIRTSILNLVFKFFLLLLWHVNYAAEGRRADWLAAWSLTSHLYSLWKQHAGFIGENKLNGKSCGHITSVLCTMCSWERHRISVRGTCKGGVLWRFLSGISALMSC